MIKPAALVAFVALLFAAPVALAHEGNPNYRSVIKGVTPATNGASFEILNFDDRVLLHNTSDQDVEVFGYESPPEPYAQIKADGTVLVNTNSKSYYLNEDRQGESAVPQDLASEPEWKELSKSGRFEWHDHRMHWMGEGDPPALTDKGKETLIDNWEIPIRVGDQPGQVAGTLTWVPLDSGGLPLGAIFAFAGLIIVLSLAVFVVRRRRGAPSEDTAKEPVEAW